MKLRGDMDMFKISMDPAVFFHCNIRICSFSVNPMAACNGAPATLSDSADGEELGTSAKAASNASKPSSTKATP